MSSEHALRSLLAGGAALAALGCVALFLVEVAHGLVAARGRVPLRLGRLGRCSPRLVGRLAEVTVTALLAIGAARPAAASTTPIRDWLTHSPTTTTTTSTTTTTADAPATDLIPPTTATLPTATTTTVATPPAPAAPTTPAPGLRQPSAPIPAPAASPSAPTYVVRPGDCLWRIAARLLGPGASNADLDAGWRALYAANRASIGDDPGLIHPGLVLTLPPMPVAR